MQGGDLEESGGELRLRKQQAAAAPLPPPPRPPPSAAAAAAAASKSSDDKRKKLKTPSWLVNARRVNVWSVKTRPPQWAALRSRWRFFEGLFFYLGPPLHLLRRLWPPMLLNACVFSLVAADHLLEAVSSAGQQRAAATAAAAAGGRHLLQDLGASGGGGGGGASAVPGALTPPPRSLFPPLSASVSASLDPVFRLSIFVVSLLLTLRLGRAYERWWEARRSFSALGSLALTLAQRGEAWFGGACDGDVLGQVQGRKQGQQQQEQEQQKHPPSILPLPSPPPPPSPSPGQLLAEDLARWGVVWQFSILQICTDSPSLHPAARRLLRPAELALYDAAPKGRQLALQRLTHLLLAEGPALAAAELNPVVVDNLLRTGATAAGACTGIKLQALPAAITLTSTGVTEAFLLLYPLSALSVGGGGKGGGGGGPQHDASVASVTFTLAIQLLLYLFVCLLFLGMAEVAGSLEDPFARGHLPVEDMARTTVRDVARARREAARVRALGLGGFGLGGATADTADTAAAAAAAAAGEPPPPAPLSLPPLSVLETVDWAGAEALCGRLKG